MLILFLLTCQLTKTNIERAENSTTVPTKVTSIAGSCHKHMCNDRTEMWLWILSLVNTWERCIFSQWHRRAARKKPTKRGTGKKKKRTKRCCPLLVLLIIPLAYTYVFIALKNFALNTNPWATSFFAKKTGDYSKHQNNFLNIHRQFFKSCVVFPRFINILESGQHARFLSTWCGSCDVWRACQAEPLESS